MRSRLAGFAAFLLVLLGGFPAPAEAQQAIVLVRHAEKQDNSIDPPLSPEGRQRAERLSDLFKNAGVSAIFTSQYLRTRQTAEPLSEQLHLSLQVVASNKLEELIGKIREHAKEVVLVVGHSNTIGSIIKGLGCTQSIDIKETQYHRIFIVVPRPPQTPLLLELSY